MPETSLALKFYSVDSALSLATHCMELLAIEIIIFMERLLFFFKIDIMVNFAKGIL